MLSVGKTLGQLLSLERKWGWAWGLWSLLLYKDKVLIKLAILPDNVHTPAK